MKNSFKKIMFKVVIHAIELLLLYTFSFWIYAIAPEGYAMAAVLLVGLVYLIYLISSLIDDYLDIKGADFMV